MQNILIVDGHNFANIHVHAGMVAKRMEPEHLRWKMLDHLHDLCMQLNIHRIIFALDSGDSAYRLALHPGYKGTRKEKRAEEAEKHPEKVKEKRNLMEVFYQCLAREMPRLGISQVQFEGIEADDIIAFFANHIDLTRYRLAILSNDTDLFQIVRPGVMQKKPRGVMKLPGSNTVVPADAWLSHDLFCSAYGLLPPQWADVKALQGDTSDNVPGIKGIGPKGAIGLVKHFESVEALLDALDDPDELEEQSEALRKSKRSGGPGLTPKVLDALLEGKDTLRLALTLVNLNYTSGVINTIFSEDQQERLLHLLTSLDAMPEIDPDFGRTFCAEFGRSSPDEWLAAFSGVRQQSVEAVH